MAPRSVLLLLVSTLMSSGIATELDVHGLNEVLLRVLERPLKVGSLRPFEARHHENRHRLQSNARPNNKDRRLGSTCNEILNALMGSDNIERDACHECYEDPNDREQYVVLCDFSNLCSFCSPEGDVCYTLTRKYHIKLMNNLPQAPVVRAYSSCATYHRDGRSACLDETFKDDGTQISKCISVDGEACETCKYVDECGGYKYDCHNIEKYFFMHDCVSSINDSIPKSSVCQL